MSGESQEHETGVGRKGLRPGIDHIGVGVGAVIVDSRGQVFLARRGPEARNERGRWEFPGGSVHFGETLAGALCREIREEFGVEIDVMELINVADHIIEAEGQHWVSPGFLCRIRSGEPCILEPDKCSEFRWVPYSVLGGYDLTGASRQTLQGLTAKYGDRLPGLLPGAG